MQARAQLAPARVELVAAHMGQAHMAVAVEARPRVQHAGIVEDHRLAVAQHMVQVVFRIVGQREEPGERRVDRLDQVRIQIQRAHCAFVQPELDDVAERVQPDHRSLGTQADRLDETPVRDRHACEQVERLRVLRAQVLGQAEAVGHDRRAAAAFAGPDRVKDHDARRRLSEVLVRVRAQGHRGIGDHGRIRGRDDLEHPPVMGLSHKADHTGQILGGAGLGGHVAHKADAVGAYRVEEAEAVGLVVLCGPVIDNRQLRREAGIPG